MTKDPKFNLDLYFQIDDTYGHKEKEVPRLFTKQDTEKNYSSHRDERMNHSGRIG